MPPKFCFLPLQRRHQSLASPAVSGGTGMERLGANPRTRTPCRASQCWGRIPGHGHLVGHQDGSRARSWGPANSSAAPGALGSTSLPCPELEALAQQHISESHALVKKGGAAPPAHPSSSLPATAPQPPFPASPRRNPPGQSRSGPWHSREGCTQGGHSARPRAAARCEERPLP